MNNWGKVSQAYYDGQSRRARARHARALRLTRHRRALIDDEDVYGSGPQTRHTSFDGFCEEQRLRIEAVFGASVERVRTAQMMHNEEGFDDGIPSLHRPRWSFDSY